MTLDQIFFMFLQSTKARKTKTVSVESVAGMMGPDGKIKGRAGGGEKIRAAWGGKSLAQRIRDGEVAFDKDGNRVEPPPKPPKPEEPKPGRRKRGRR